MSCCSKTEDKEIKASNCSAETETVQEESCCATGPVKEETSCCGPEGPVKEETSCCSSEPVEEEASCCGPEEPVKEEASCCSAEAVKEETSCCGPEEPAKEETSCGSSNQTVTPIDSEKKIELTVLGMDCPSCATTLEKALEQLSSVTEAKVSYNTEKVQLVTTENYSISEIEKTVKKLGFTVEPEKSNQNKNQQTYDVQGMDCGSCAKSIENHLIKIPGVNSAQVNFAAGNMKVDHTNPATEIVKEVAKLGFDAALQADTSMATGLTRNGQELIKVVVSGVLITTGFIGTYTGLPTPTSIILFALAIITSGYQPIKSAYYAIKSRSLDMNVLMSTAAIGAAIIGEWFEGATVVWLFSLGIYLQNKSMNQTRDSIRNLMNMAPQFAWIKVGSELVQKSVEEVSVGDTIVIKPGDKIPLDGDIVIGASSINQSPITGESLPVDKEVGDEVFAGTMNESGAIEVEVTKLVADTTLAKIIHLVEEAQEQKAPTEAFIDRFAAVYTPIVFILALIVIVIPPILGFGTWNEWIYKGLALIVVACPCALVISTPVAIVSAIGNAAKNGVLIKGGTFLEIAGKIDAVAFDKTGTLTEGKPQVSDVNPVNISEEELLSIAYTLESHSTHPIAKMVVEYAKEKQVQPAIGSAFENIVGKGVSAMIDGEIYYAGNPKLFAEMNVDISNLRESLVNMQKQGKTLVIIGNSQEALGLIGVTDTIRTTTVDTLTNLREVGMKQIVMLTGDNEGTAKLISEQTSINRYFAELLPEDKVTALKQLQSEGNTVAMVGDGINDAPALATADLGIAMGGSGTDTAMETADVVLMADNLEKLPYTVKLSRKAITIIKQNIWFSILIKVVALALIFPGWLTLWMAVLSDTGAAIIVILNALRLLRD